MAQRGTLPPSTPAPHPTRTRLCPARHHRMPAFPVRANQGAQCAPSPPPWPPDHPQAQGSTCALAPGPPARKVGAPLVRGLQPQPQPQAQPQVVQLCVAGSLLALVPQLPALAQGDLSGAAPGVPLLPLGLLTAAALAYGVLRAAAYFSLQYTTAAVLTRFVPTGASKVLDLSVASGRHLYYLPSSVAQVVALNPSVDPAVVKAQAIQAGIDVSFPMDRPRPASLDDTLAALRRMPAASFDAAISIGGVFAASSSASGGSSAVSSLGKDGEPEYALLLREVVRLLRPGKPLVFLERASTSSVDPGSPLFFMTQMDADLFDQITWDYTLTWVDKHVVGVAIVPLKSKR